VREFFHWRVLAILAIVGAALFANTKLIAHHTAPNAFIQLFSHLMPEPLIQPAAAHGHGAEEHATDDHGEQAAAAHTSHNLLEVPLPGFLGFFDMTGVKDASGHVAHPKLVLTNLQIFQISAILLIFVCFSGVARYLRSGRGDIVSRYFAGWAHWLRDEVVYPVMGAELGSKWLPFFLTIFFFVLFMNVQGMLPHGATATASIFVTGGLAMITFTCMMVFGMKEQGVVGYWKNLVPHVPGWLWPVMFVVELMGVIVKPVALTLRLFATMMGGHMIVLTFMGLLFFLAENMGATVAYAVSPASVGFAVFIMIIESFVVLLQAFIFTQLSVIFINAAVHPEH
jgi:ATP synthase subunit 6